MTCRFDRDAEEYLTPDGDPCRRDAILDRLFAHREIEDRGYSTPCWVSTYTKDLDGYAKIKLRPDPNPKQVHRVAYELLVGPIPAGLVIDHLCKTVACFNPTHLEPVTQAVNVLRGDGWAPKFKAQTHCKRGHEFTPENTYRSAKGRMCRRCAADKARARYRQRRLEETA